MAGLVPAIHVFSVAKTWMPGTKPGMTLHYPLSPTACATLSASRNKV
jgi:hypothetical protein